ncbi:MAG: hypothetical protein OXN90_10640 [Gemmatimonadota bacterium]|nr:hypothetical protein [Gemmatimonadota bacterium]
MNEIAMLCTILLFLLKVKPWSWLKRLWRRVRRILEDRRNRDDELEIWQVPGYPGYFFKSKRLYE